MMAPMIDPQNLTQIMHDASQQLEMGGDQTGKNPLQETFPYPFTLPFTNPQAILYEGFKFKRNKALTKKLSAPFRHNKVNEPLKDVDLPKRKGNGKRMNEQEEGGGDNNDNDNDNGNDEKGKNKEDKDGDGEGKKDGNDNGKDNYKQDGAGDNSDSNRVSYDSNKFLS